MKSNDAPETIDPLLRKRFSSRSFDPSPVPRDDIEQFFQGAQWAPSYGNRQSWRFIAVDEQPTLDKLRDLLTRGNAYAKAAPLLIAVCSSPDYGQIVGDLHYYLMDVGLGTENLLLQATSMGYHTHPMGGFDQPAARELLGLPEDAHVLALVAIGKPGDLDDLPERDLEREERTRRRHPLDQIRAYNSWNAALVPTPKDK